MAMQQTASDSITDGRELLDPQYYAQNGPPHEIWTRLRRASPVHWCDGIPEIEPFWAITRHADICWISSRPELFISEPGIRPAPRTRERLQSDFDKMRVVISTDPPEHRKLRKVASPWFTPRALRRIDGAVEECARRLIDELGREGETDLARGLAVSHPLRILATALGVSREHEQRILELSNKLFAPADPDLGGGLNQPEHFRKLGQEFVKLFLPIIENRRKHPTDDLASLLANAKIDGEPMGPMETLGYYLIIFNAGHDTTKNALAGGFRALIEHPAEFDKVRRDESRAADAVEEILRWTSSVNYMKRTAVRDVELGGRKIREGEAVLMFYGSANRDESVFEDPFRFTIDRNPNRHVAFGYGEHFCLGAHMARRSQRALIQELARRVERWEIAGEPKWIASSFVIGLKQLPVRYRLAPRA
jgi:cytochrome P450